MPLKFSRTSSYPPKQSPLQKAQWNQFAAIGYSVGIRGYLLCWRQILKAAGFDANDLWQVDSMIAQAVILEKRARWNIKHLRSLK